MARKETYLYKVEMGKGNVALETSYCYARNAGVAVEEMKELNKEKKYDYFRALAFAEVDIRIHPERFELVPKDEVDYIKQMGYGETPPYSNRKDRDFELPENATFVLVGEKVEQQ